MTEKRALRLAAMVLAALGIGGCLLSVYGCHVPEGAIDVTPSVAVEDLIDAAVAKVEARFEAGEVSIVGSDSVTSVVLAFACGGSVLLSVLGYPIVVRPLRRRLFPDKPD